MIKKFLFHTRHQWLEKTALLLTIVLISSSFSQNKWLPFKSGQPPVTISKGSTSDQLPKPKMTYADSGSKGFEFDYTFPGAVLNEKSEQGDNYQLMRIDEFNLLNDPGKPALPARWFTLVVPDGMVPQIRILQVESVDLKNYNILPARKPASDKVGAPEPAFEIDSQTYKSNLFFPESPVCIKSIQKYRGKAIAKIQVCPVQYNPAKKTITVYSRLHFKVDFQQGKGTVDLSNRFKNQHSILLSNFTGNSLSVTGTNKQFSDYSSLEQLRGGYLIVTTPAYAQAADTLALWKRRMGYTVWTISQTGWTSAMVRDSIRNRYATSIPPLEFCTIIGDHPDVPSQLVSTAGTSHVTDLYYACMDGSSDYTPDFGYGRISVSSATEAMTVVHKIVNYERNPITDASFYNTGLAAAYFQHASGGYEERRFLQTSWEIEQYLVNQQGYSVDREYYTESSVSPTNWNNGSYSMGDPIPTYLRRPTFAWDGDAAGISASINAGRFLVTHRDHGDVTLWGDPYYTTSHISNLTNGSKLPVVLSLNCLTGQFDNSSTCFSEVFLRHPTGGAVGVVGATEVSYSGQNDGLAPGIIDAIWPVPGLVPLFPHNRAPSVTPHQPIYHMGLVLNQGKMRMSETWNGGTEPWNYEQYTYELFHFFGDPSMQIWTAQPAALTASAPSVIMIGQQSFTISGASCADGVATLLFNGNVIGVSNLVNGSGTMTINPAPMEVGTALLTITSHNFRPLQQNIEIIPPGDALFPVNPVAGTIFDNGESINTTWQTFGQIPNVRIEFSSDNGTTFTILTQSIENINSYSFNAPAVESDSCVIRISDVDGNPSNVSQRFSIHNLSTISGTIFGATSGQVFYSGPANGSVTTNANGAYSITRLLPGTYSLYAQYGQYRSATAQTTVPPDRNINFTIDFPQISLTPGSLKTGLASGDKDTLELVVRNQGNAVLDYSISGADLTGLVSTASHEQYDSSHFIEIPKGSTDTRVGKEIIDGSGGPDLFGYTWIDSDEPNGPVFSWVDIRTTGTLLSAISSCDDCYTSAPIGFSFPFYGINYTTAYVSSNGYICFGSGSSNYTNYPLPSTSMPANLIAAYYDDLSTSESGDVYYQNYSDHTIFQFNDVSLLSGSGRYTFQIVLWKDSKIELKYQSVSGSTTSATIGIQNGTRNDGLQIAYNSAYIKNSLAVTIRCRPSWLQLTKNSGSVAPGNTDVVGVIFDATETETGSFIDTLNISHNAPVPSINVPCTLLVDGSKRISASPSTLNFGQRWIGNSTTLPLILANSGNEPTTVSSISISNTAFTREGPVTPFTLPPNGQITIPVTYLPATAGSHTGTMTIQSDADDNPTLSISLQGTGIISPAISFSPESITKTMPANSVDEASLVIENTGGDVLTVSIECPNQPSWLTFSPATGTINGGTTLPVALQFNSQNLAVGEYQATLNLIHNGTNLPSPVNIPVVLNVFQNKLHISRILSIGPSACGTVSGTNLTLKRVSVGSASSGTARGNRYTLIFK